LELLFSLGKTLVDGIANWFLLIAGSLFVIGWVLIFMKPIHHKITPPSSVTQPPKPPAK
jgi:hypothetical protein